MIAEQKRTLMKRRKIAIIVSSVIIALLIPVLILVRIVATTAVFEDVNGDKYLIRYKDGVYAMYTTDGEKLPVDGEFGYYITESGTLVKVDSESGSYEIAAIVDTEDIEEIGSNSRILMFPHIEREDILSIDVVNQTGAFSLCRYNPETDTIDMSGDFIIKGAPFSPYDQDVFSSLVVGTGYTLSTTKIKDPIKDGDGEFSEYGLVSEIRVDDDGNEYEYTPAHYVITTSDGTKHKVIIGDKLVTGGGYYAQYVKVEGKAETKRDAVYVLSTANTSVLLDPVEEYVSPTLTYPLQMKDYIMLENFSISRKNEASSDGYDTVVGFTYIDLDDRLNTIAQYFTHKFISSNFDGYIPDGDNINIALYSLYEPAYEDVIKLMPTDKDLVEYGLAKEVEKDGKTSVEFYPKYVISYDYEVPEDDSELGRIRPALLISEKNEAGNYYVYTVIYDANEENGELLYSYDMIIEVKGHTLSFLEWDRFKWIDRDYMTLDLSFCEKIELSAPGYSAVFDLDNSKSDQSQGSSSKNLIVNASDSSGKSIETFSSLTVVDKTGNIWEITDTEINCYNSSGTKLSITTASYAFNKVGIQVRVVDGYIECRDGRTVKVTADEVTVTSPGGDETVYARYGLSLFRRFYTTLTSSNLEDSYEMSAEAENALINDESKWLLTLKITDTEGGVKEYKFYSITNRKAYVTINGNGGFYVQSNRVLKYKNDAIRFFAGENIDYTAKN